VIEPIVVICDVCGRGDDLDLYRDEGDSKFRCTDCYLRHHGFDPEALAEQFAFFAKRILGEQLEQWKVRSREVME